MIRMNETLFCLVINPQLTPDKAAYYEGKNRPPTKEVNTCAQDGKKEKRASRPACIHHAAELSEASQDKQHDVTNDNHLHNPLIQMRKTMLIFNRRENNATWGESQNKGSRRTVKPRQHWISGFFVARMERLWRAVWGSRKTRRGAYSSVSQPCTACRLFERRRWDQTH